MIIIERSKQLKEVLNDLLKDQPVIVVDQGKLIGVIDRRALNIYKNQNTKIDRITRSITGLTEDDLKNMEKIIEGLMENGDYLIIVDKDRRPKKIIKINDLKDSLAKFVNNIDIKELIDTHVETINEKESLEQARAIMIRNGLEYLIVTNSKNMPVGIITYDEVLMYSMLSNKPGRRDYETNNILNKSIKELIYKEVSIINLKTPIIDLLDRDIHVVYERGIRGVIKRKDLLKRILKNLRYTRSDVQIFGIEDNYTYGIVLDELTSFKERIGKILKEPMISLRIKGSRVYEGKLTIHSQNYPILIAEDLDYDPITLTKRLISIIQNKLSRSKKGKKKIDY